VTSKVGVFGIHLNIDWLGDLSVKSSCIFTLLISVYKSISCNNETSTERDNSLNLEVIHWRVWNEGHVRSIVITDNDLSDFGTDNKRTVRHPSMARVSGGNVSILVVNLSMVSFEFTIFNFVVLIGISTSDNDLVGGVWVKGDLKVTILWFRVTLLVHGGWDTSDSNLTLGHDLQFFPVPEDQHPVWSSSQSDNDLVFSLWREACAQEFLGLIISAINIWIR